MILNENDIRGYIHQSNHAATGINAEASWFQVS